jgi:uncharacterized membrane protein
MNSWMFEPFFYITWITTIVVWAFFTRWWVDDKKRSPNHGGQFVLRIVFAFANTFIYYGFDPDVILDGINDQNLWEILWALKHWVALLAIQGALFWDLFDPLLNYLRNRHYKYVSKSNIFDKWFHRFKDPWKAQLIAKIIATAVTIFLVIITNP